MRRKNGLLIGALSALLVLLYLAGDRVELALRYQRQEVLQGEWWRLLTAHLVHGSLRHLVLNIAGLYLVASLLREDFSRSEWFAVVAAVCTAIGSGFIWLNPDLQWYVGLSGVLHGCLAAGAVVWWRSERPLLAAALTALLLVKLSWEQLHGALPLAGALPVIVDAHLYGAIGGALAALAIIARRSITGRTYV